MFSAVNSIVGASAKNENSDANKPKPKKVKTCDLGLDYLLIKKEIQKKSVLTLPPRSVLTN